MIMVLVKKLPHLKKKNNAHFAGSALLVASVFGWLDEPFVKPFTRKADLSCRPKSCAIVH